MASDKVEASGKIYYDEKDRGRMNIPAQIAVSMRFNGYPSKSPVNISFDPGTQTLTIKPISK